MSLALGLGVSQNLAQESPGADTALNLNVYKRILIGTITSQYGNETSRYFDLQPPSWQEYFS